MKTVVVIGTGTGVGKTHVACGLVAHGVALGLRCAGLKPIESGVDEGVETDAMRLQGYANVRAPAALYAFAQPVSPHLAARESGRRISVRKTLDWVAAVRADLRVVETAGGLMSPLAPLVWNRHVVEGLAPDGVVVVAPDRLGVLHEVGATLCALGRLGSVVAVALSEVGAGDASTGTNGAELLEAGVVNGPVAVFPRGEVDDRRNGAAAAMVWSVLFP